MRGLLRPVLASLACAFFIVMVPTDLAAQATAAEARVGPSPDLFRIERYLRVTTAEGAVLRGRPTLSGEEDRVRIGLTWLRIDAIELVEERFVEEDSVNDGLLWGAGAGLVLGTMGALFLPRDDEDEEFRFEAIMMGGAGGAIIGVSADFALSHKEYAPLWPRGGGS